MKKLTKISLCLILSLGIITGCQEVSKPQGKTASLTEDIKKESIDTKEALTKENTKIMTDLGGKLLEKTLSKDGENTLISPLSIVYALAMTENGADGNTLKEFEDSFGLSRDELNKYLNAYLASLPTSEDYKFNLANSIWINENSAFSPNEDFLKVNKDYLDAQIYEAAFNKETVESINNWVKENTQEMIPSVIDEIQEGEIMYLINALALDAKWDREYSLESVIEDTFTKEDGKEIKADFMYEDGYKYIEGSEETGFVKDYKEGKYAFVALLPQEGMKIEDYVKTLSGEKIQGLLENVEETKVRTMLPKFETNYSLSLVDSLKALGINEAFSPEAANFSKMGSADGNIFISNVIHKTFIAVDELGTKAGAVTAVVMEATSMPIEEPKEVYLTRPFVYMIIDTENKVPMFIGTMMDVGE